jgi:hypothetical protein
MAMAVGRFILKPKGQANYFIQVKHTVRPQGSAPMGSRSLRPATQRMAKWNILAVVSRVTTDWHPATQAAIVTLATAKQLPSEVKQCAAQPSTPSSKIRGVIYMGWSKRNTTHSFSSR